MKNILIINFDHGMGGDASIFEVEDSFNIDTDNEILDDLIPISESKELDNEGYDIDEFDEFVEYCKDNNIYEDIINTGYDEVYQIDSGVGGEYEEYVDNGLF